MPSHVESSHGQRASAHHERRHRNTAELRAWATRYGRGAKTLLTKRSGLTFAAVSRIVDGDAQPSPESARLLSAATDGEVSAASMLGLDTPPSREPASSDVNSDAAE